MSPEWALGLLTLAVVGGALGFTIAPLLRKGPAQLPPWSGAVGDGALLASKEQALEALEALEWDYQLGNLEDNEYQRLQAALQHQAIALLQEEEQKREALEEAVEAMVAARRRALAGDGQAPRRRRRSRPAPRRSRRAAEAQATARPRRVVKWLLGGALAMALFGLAVVLLVVRAPGRSPQRPIATVPVANHVHSLAISPAEPELVLLGHHDGLLTSTDGGHSWQPILSEPNLDFMTIATDPAQPLLVYGAGHMLFMRSEDGGRSWSPMVSDLPGLDLHGFAIAPGDPETLYAYVVGRGLFRSEDGGAHWQLLSAQLPTSTAALAAASGGHPQLYLAAPGQGILASNDGKSWWNVSGALSGALPTNMVTGLAFNLNSGESYTTSSGQTLTGTLYAATDMGAFRSIDSGQSWQRLGLNTAIATLAVSPQDPRLLLAIDYQGRLFRSADRGVTWPGR